jgi:HD-GYP domain-containing protein (c-di-GMP phosphodiesterase class II)
MKHIKIEDLKAGMRFTQAVYIDRDTLFLEPNLALKQIEIDRLVKWKVKEVHTEGDVAKQPTREEQEGASQKGYQLSSRRARQLFDEVLQGLGEIFAAVETGGRADYNLADDISSRLLKAVEAEPENMSQLVLLPGESSNLLESSVKTTILSSVMGKTLKIYGFRLVQLAKGALLHDIGMLKVPKAIRSKKGKLTPDELKIVKTHPAQGYAVALKDLKCPEEVAGIILYHQERWDGTGYPKGLKRDNIPVGARIVAVADAFEALVNRRAYRDPIIGYRAMKAILSDNGRHFDPAVLKALLGSLGIYPTGSLVLLNNSCIGKVLQNRASAPVRPRIQLLVNESGERMTERREIDLLEHKDLFIAKAVDPQNIDEAADA